MTDDLQQEMTPVRCVSTSAEKLNVTRSHAYSSIIAPRGESRGDEALFPALPTLGRVRKKWPVRLKSRKRAAECDGCKW